MEAGEFREGLSPSWVQGWGGQGARGSCPGSVLRLEAQASLSLPRALRFSKDAGGLLLF